ncbi:zinc carboxypeptidase [Flavobacteriaceae bacterium MAR_2010_72]|nr:zinc carboxypeptidase [Flavobacteriaceae bacterium MAR_2010_72]TVZ59628.1 zinc carboxypeptidase [Flavobacteriaceae bacterium MAR_2010_105]
MVITVLNQWFEIYKERSLFHRYIAQGHVAPLLKNLKTSFKIESIGQSVLGVSIDVILVGTGNKKIFMWSQMHGNESTTTKAVFDILNAFENCEDHQIKQILSSCTIAIIPMLNPDGAKAYTRSNANEIDLNRDAQELSQPESKVLMKFYKSFKPDFCFNLHGQRTIFSAGKANKPATVSFLAPAQDESCAVTNNRRRAMEIIVQMNKVLQKQIPHQVGVYDDSFNINCVGDTFQRDNVPTVLFEAGHYAHDYPREVTRRYIFQSLLTAMNYIATTEITGNYYNDYFEIPQNEKLFYDIIIRNSYTAGGNFDIAVMFQEKLIEKTIEFVPIVEKIEDLNGFYGHKEINANNNAVLKANLEPLKVGDEIDFVLINSKKFSLILKNI